MVGRRIRSNVALPFSVRIAALVIAVGGMFLLSQMVQPILESQEQGDWVIYRSEELGIEFEYPRAFHEKDTCRIQAWDNATRLQFSLWGIESKATVGQGFEPFLKKFIQERKGEGYIESIISEERIEIEGHLVLVIEHYTSRHFSGSGSPDRRAKLALIENGEHALFVSFINGITKCGAPIPGDPFDHLISTLHFVS